ncbi:MAG: hypothetical protein ACOVJ8_01200 [Sediminibacterium sp.]
MADKVVSLEFNVKTAGAVTEINKVTQATEGATAATNEYEKQLNDIKKATDGAGFKDLNKALKQYQDLALQAGENSPIGRQALSEAGELKDRLLDLKAAIKTTGQDGRSLQASLQLGGGIVAGFGAVQGVMALVGSESEDLQKTLVKLQAVQATLASVEEIRSVLEKESALRITAVTIAEKGRAAATAVSTFVTNGASLALKVFRGALIATGIGAFIVVLGSVIAYWDELTQAIGLTTKSTADYTSSLDKLSAKEQRRLNNNIELQKNELKLAEIKGESAKQLFEREQKINDLELKARERQRETDQILIDSYKKRRKSGEEFTDDEKQRFDQLKENEKNYYSEIGKIEFDARLIKETFYKSESDKEKEAVEKRKKQREQEAIQKGLEAQKEYETRAEALLLLQQLDDQEKLLRDQKIADEAEALIIAMDNEAILAEEKKKQREKDLEDEIRVRDAKVQIANDLQSTLTSLGNLIINDSAKAVKFNKAMALIQIGIDTATALSKALSVTQSPSPDNVATGGLAGVAKYAGIAAMIFANAAKAKQILSSGNASGTVPTLGGGGAPGQQMQTGAPTLPGSQSTMLREQVTTVKAIVVESDITSTQKRVNSIKENATI